MVDEAADENASNSVNPSSATPPVNADASRADTQVQSSTAPQSPSPGAPNGNEDTPVPVTPSAGPVSASSPSTPTLRDIGNATGSFFGGLFRAASTTVESSVQIVAKAGTDAVQTVAKAGTDAVQTAQNAGTSAVSAVSGMVTDLGAVLSDERNSRLSRNFRGADFAFARVTKVIRSSNVSEIVLLLINGSLVLGSEAVCVLDAQENGLSDSGMITLPYVYDEGERPVLAEIAAMLSPDKVILSSLDGHLRIVSVASANVLASLHGERAQRVSDPRLCFLPSKEETNPIAIGLDNGHIQIFKIEEHARRRTIPPPTLCSSALPASMQAPAVTCVETFSLDVNGNVQVVAGYADGVVSMLTVEETPKHFAFVAHGGKVSGLVIMHGVLALTIGDSMDSSVAVFDVYSGRCLSRRMLKYAPTYLSHQYIPQEPSKGTISPSEQVFIIGGKEGQVEIFQLVVLSSEKVAFKLVKTLSNSNQPAKKASAVLNTYYDHQKHIMTILRENGEVRQWHFSREDACALALLQVELNMKPVFTEDSIVDAMGSDTALPEGNRLDSIAGILKAQEVLASILDDPTVPELYKDDLTQDFQACQANIIVSAAQADTDFKRSRKRLVSRFEAGVRQEVKGGSMTEVELSKAAKRNATMEMQFIIRRHVETLARVHKYGVHSLKTIIMRLLKSLPSRDSETLQHLVQEVETLGESGDSPNGSSDS